MVSPNSSTEEASADSMAERENRFYGRVAPTREAPPSTSSSESVSESESDEESTRVVSPQKKPQPIPINKNVAAVTPKSSTKRPREEEQSRGLEKNKKLKEAKKTPILEAPKQSDKKPSEDKKKVKISESPTKSAKKNGQVWTTHDEIGFLKGFMEYQASKVLPKSNLTPVYEYIRSLNVLQHDYSNMQMYDKLRRLKIKYAGLRDKITGGDFTFKNSHDENIYKLGRKCWGSREEEEKESANEEEEKNGHEGVEEDEEKRKGVDVEAGHKVNEEEEEEDEDDDEATVKEGILASNGAKKQSKQSSKETRKPSHVSDVALNNGSARDEGKLIDLLHKENLAMMNEMKKYLAREKQEMNKVIKEMVREAFQSLVSTGTGDSVEFSSEEMIKRISSLRELPKLEKAEADRLENKWQRQHLIELDASCKHLQLLQEECQVRMEKLRSQAEKKNP